MREAPEILRFDRSAISVERLEAFAATERGRGILLRRRADLREYRRVYQEFLIAQLAECDELLQRLDVVLDEGLTA